jgi:gas vesicle protein
MFGFLIGALVGSAAAYLWHDKIRSYVDTKLPVMRDRAAEQIGTIGQRAGDALDQAKSRLDSTVRTSQQRLRTTRPRPER